MEHPITAGPPKGARTADPEKPKAHEARLRPLPTGIPGLDDILNGGFPEHRLYLIEGAPGSGKTTLALQFLLEGVRNGEGGMYVTLAETRRELEDVAASHGWSLDGITLLDMGTGSGPGGAESQYTVFHPSEVELQDTVDRILAEVEAHRPKRVVLDSLSDMRLLARDPLRFRRQILALKQIFSGRDVTVLLLDDQTADEADMQLYSLAHGVMALEQIPLVHGGERRQLRMSKLRGVRFHAGYHDFVIRTGGLDVFPRIRLDAIRNREAQGVLQSGSQELDALFGGGIPWGTSILITGAPGTGKSVLSAQYAAAAAAHGIRVALYLFDERAATYLERARGLRLGVERYIESGHILINRVEPTEISPGEFTARVLAEVEDGTRLIVVDSLNGFNKAMAQEQQLTVKIHELLSYLGGLGVTTLLTLAQRGIFGRSGDESADLSYLADGVVLLRYFEAHGEVRRAISVLKQRSGDHERTIREFRLGRGGLRLGSALNEFHGVLTGIPTFTGTQGSLLRPGGGAPVQHQDGRP